MDIDFTEIKGRVCFGDFGDFLPFNNLNALLDAVKKVEHKDEEVTEVILYAANKEAGISMTLKLWEKPKNAWGAVRIDEQKLGISQLTLALDKLQKIKDIIGY